MRRYGMEITFGLIVLAIFILAIALAWIVYIENPRKASEYRMNERRNMIELIRSIKPVTTATFVALPDYDADSYDFVWHVIHFERATQSPQSDPTQPASDEDTRVDAVSLISASIDITNPDRKPNQLMTADECQKHGVLGGDRDRRQRAVKYLTDQFNVVAHNNKGPTNNGVFYMGGTLNRLIVEMAVKSRPRPGSRAAYDESQQTARTL